MFHPKTDNPIGDYGPLDVFIHPRNYIECDDPPSDYLEFQLELPDDLLIQNGEISCKIGKDGIVPDVCSYSAGLP